MVALLDAIRQGAWSMLLFLALCQASCRLGAWLRRHLDNRPCSMFRHPVMGNDSLRCASPVLCSSCHCPLHYASIAAVAGMRACYACSADWHLASRSRCSAPGTA